MNIVSNLASVIFISGLISCGGDASYDSKTEKNETATLPNSQTNIENNSQPSLPLTETPQNNIASTEINTGKNNPPHGQPGHVCETPVGQTITDKAVPQSITTQPAITAIQSSPVQAIATKPGLNPAHGQPGHRCDISVGAPLTDAASVAPTVNAPKQPIINSPVVSTPLDYKPNLTTDTKVAAGMNPAHGQPGHRCDIAVGAPLNKKVENK